MVQTREYKSAELFIDKYIEQTNNREDRILFGDLYKEYIESSKQTVGRNIFNRILKDNGFSVMRSAGNKMMVFYVKSTWL